MRFNDFTITLAADRFSRRRHYSEQIDQRAKRVFAGMFAAHGSASFEQPIPVDVFAHLTLSWTSEQSGTALATFFSGDVPLTTSAICSGADPAADRRALRAAQSLVVDLLKRASGGAKEPGFDLLSLDETPLIASVVLLVPPDKREDLQIVADMETCLAAAYFEEYRRAQT